MNVQRTNITLPYDLLQQLKMSIPTGKRSKFIARAIAEKLKTKRALEKAMQKSLKANYELDKKVAAEWAVTEVEGWPE